MKSWYGRSYVMKVDLRKSVGDIKDEILETLLSKMGSGIQSRVKSRQANGGKRVVKRMGGVEYKVVLPELTSRLTFGGKSLDDQQTLSSLSLIHISEPTRPY